MARLAYAAIVHRTVLGPLLLAYGESRLDPGALPATMDHVTSPKDHRDDDEVGRAADPATSSPGPRAHRDVVGAHSKTTSKMADIVMPNLKSLADAMTAQHATTYKMADVVMPNLTTLADAMTAQYATTYKMADIVAPNLETLVDAMTAQYATTYKMADIVAPTLKSFADVVTAHYATTGNMADLIAPSLKSFAEAMTAQSKMTARLGESPETKALFMQAMTDRARAATAFTNPELADTARRVAESALREAGVELPSDLEVPDAVADPFDDDSAWYAVEAVVPEFTRTIDAQLTSAGLPDAQIRLIRRGVLVTVWWVATAVTVTTGTFVGGPLGGVVAALLSHFSSQAATDKVMGWAGFGEDAGKPPEQDTI